jgi:type VI secretion system FHA domain protein
MTLRLAIVGANAASLGAAATKEFSATGGTIGRAVDNDWVIEDAYISGYHARILYRDGHYFLEDTSTNGVFVKVPGNRLSKGRLHQLRTGDRFFIDNYEVSVSLEGVDQNGPTVVESILDDELTQAMVMGNDAVRESIAPAAAVDNDYTQYTTPMQNTAQDEIKVINFNLPKQKVQVKKSKPRAPKQDSPENSGATFFVEDIFGAKAIAPEQASPPPAQPLPASTPVSTPNDPLRTAFAAAGLSLDGVSPESMKEMAQIVRIVMAGLMEVLRARGQFKDEFGMRATKFRPTENNPLKFSANVEDALHNLFVKRNDAYLDSPAAFSEAFSEIRLHQTAMMLAMRVAFDAAIRHFDPDKVQQQVDRNEKRGGIKFSKGGQRYWEAYREAYLDMSKSPDESFHRIFGTEFSKAYQDQFQRLKL